MTERHGDGGCDLAQNVQGKHDRDRLKEALGIVEEAALQLIVGNENEYQDRPTCNDVDIGGGSEYSEEARCSRNRTKTHDKRTISHDISHYSRYQTALPKLEEIIGLQRSYTTPTLQLVLFFCRSVSF